MKIWREIALTDNQLKKIVQYLDSSLNSEYDGNRAIDISKLSFDGKSWIVTFIQTGTCVGDGFSNRFQNALTIAMIPNPNYRWFQVGNDKFFLLQFFHDGTVTMLYHRVDRDGNAKVKKGPFQVTIQDAIMAASKAIQENDFDLFKPHLAGVRDG